MAHTNPEFALGLMQRDHAPVRHQLPGPASLKSLRARMIHIAATPCDERTPEEEHALNLWYATCRQQDRGFARERRLRDAISDPAGGMHAGGKIGERFVEPVRRGEGRTKRWAVS